MQYKKPGFLKKPGFWFERRRRRLDSSPISSYFTRLRCCQKREDREMVETEKKRRGRRGAAMVIALVCLSVVMLLSATIVRNLVFHQRQTRADQQRLQALWLAESAVDRAYAALRSDPEFTSSVWHVELAGAHGTQTGVAEITVELDEGLPRQRRVRVVARWPDDPVYGSVHRKNLIVNLPESGDPS